MKNQNLLTDILGVEDEKAIEAIDVFFSGLNNPAKSKEYFLDIFEDLIVKPGASLSKEHRKELRFLIQSFCELIKAFEVTEGFVIGTDWEDRTKQQCEVSNLVQVVVNMFNANSATGHCEQLEKLLQCSIKRRSAFPEKITKATIAHYFYNFRHTLTFFEATERVWRAYNRLEESQRVELPDVVLKHGQAFVDAMNQALPNGVRITVVPKVEPCVIKPLAGAVKN